MVLIYQCSATHGKSGTKQTLARDLVDRALCEFGTVRSIDHANESVHKFLLDVVCAMQPISDIYKAPAVLVETQLRDNTVLSFLSSEGLHGPAQLLKLNYIDLSAVSWPSLRAIEDAHFNDVPPHAQICDAIKLLPRALPKYSVLGTIIHAIIDSLEIRSKVDFSAGSNTYAALDFSAITTRLHSMFPYLWLAVYLVREIDAAVEPLLSRGLIGRLREICDTHLFDSEVSGADRSWPGSSTTDGQIRNDLHRLIYTLVRMIAKRAGGALKDERIASELQALKDDLREDMQSRSRMSCARYR